MSNKTPGRTFQTTVRGSSAASRPGHTTKSVPLQLISKCRYSLPSSDDMGTHRLVDKLYSHMSDLEDRKIAEELREDRDAANTRLKDQQRIDALDRILAR